MAGHLSICVPWKDNGYDGFVCEKPCYNNACLRLKNIAENRDDAKETNRTMTTSTVQRQFKSKVIIADALFDKKIEYEYEKPLDFGEDGIKSPDFTIEDVESGSLFYWEHCGMMSDDGYRIRWEAKRALYEKHGIVEGETLIVSEDKPDGSIDSQAIRKLIMKYLA